MSEKRYAFGMNECRGHLCPSVAALGKPPGSAIADYYDGMLAEKYEVDYGVVDEEVAREAWLDTIEKLKDVRDGHERAVEKEGHDERADDAEAAARHVEAAEEIAEELGWL